MKINTAIISKNHIANLSLRINNMLGIFFAFLSTLGQGSAHTILKKSFLEFPPSIAFLFETIFGLLIWIPFAFITGIDWSHIGTVFFYAMISAILSEAYVFYALSKGQLSIASTLFSTYPIFTIIFSKLINQDNLDDTTLCFILIIVSGILQIAIPKKFQKQELSKKALILLPLSAALAVGISDSLSKSILDHTSTGTFLFCLAIMQIPISLGFLYLEKQKFNEIKLIFTKLPQYKFAILGSGLLVSSMICFWLAFANTLASIASTITGTHLAFVLIFAKFFLREKITSKDYAGIIIILFGLMGLSLVNI